MAYLRGDLDGERVSDREPRQEVEGQVTGLDKDLATLRDGFAKYQGQPRHLDYSEEHAALDRVEAELSRLRKLWEQETERAIKAEGINWDKAQENARLREQRDAAHEAYLGVIGERGAAEARCARLQQALERIAAEYPVWNAGIWSREALAGPDTPADSAHVLVSRIDLLLAFGSHPLRDDHTCPICEKRESAAHYCWPREAARERLRKAGLDGAR